MVVHLPEEEQERIIGATEMRQHTEPRIVQPGEFRRLLQKAHKDNYCVTRSLHFRGNLSVAAPIFNGAGEAVASVSITSLEFDGPDEQREPTFVKAVGETATAISKALGALG